MGQLSNLRVVDPVLTNIIQGYRNESFIADEVFPIVDVRKEAGKIPTLTKEHFKQFNTARAIGADTNVAQMKFLGTPISYELTEHDFGIPIDYREEDEASEVLSLQTHATNMVSDILLLRRELAVATAVQNPSNYPGGSTSSPGTKWNQASSTPLADIRAAIELVRQKIARKPNLIVLPSDVYNVLIDHDDFTDRIKYTQLGTVTPQLIATLLDVEKVVVGQAAYSNDAESTMTQVWTDNCVIAHVTTTARANRNPFIPSFGYTLQKRSFPQVDTYPGAGGKVQIVRGTYIEDQVFHGAVAGYLLSNVLA